MDIADITDARIILTALLTVSDETAQDMIEILLEAGEKPAAIWMASRHFQTSKRFAASLDGVDIEYDVESKRSAAEAYVEGGDWGDDDARTRWVTIQVHTRWHVGMLAIDEDDREGYTIEIEPTEPECSGSHAGHHWVAPHEVVGGLPENPGVVARGGGVVITEICEHCGLLKLTDTWAQNPEDGREGFTATQYVTGAHDYREDWQRWSQRRRLASAQKLLAKSEWEARFEACDDRLVLSVPTGDEQDGEWPEAEATKDEIQELLGADFDVAWDPDSDGGETFDLHVTLA